MGWGVAPTTQIRQEVRGAGATPHPASPTIGRPKDARPLDGLWGEEAQRSDPARKFQSKKLKNR